SRLASLAELDTLMRVLGAAETGAAMLNAEAEYGAAASAEAKRRWAEVGIDWAFNTGRPIIAPEGSLPAFSEQYRRANESGARILGYFFSKPFDTCTSFRGHLAFDTLPGWREFRNLSLPDQRSVLLDPDRRA